MDQKLYPKEMHGAPNKYRLPVHFSKAKLACYPFVTIYYLYVLNFLQISPHLLQHTYRVDPKRPTTRTFTQKLQKITRVLLVVLVIFRMSGDGLVFERPYVEGVKTSGQRLGEKKCYIYIINPGIHLGPPAPSRPLFMLNTF